MYEKMAYGKGFIAALDQSGGSTPKALRLYGIDESSYSTDEEMHSLIHEMRARIITSPSFTGEKIIGTILFEMTMDRTVQGMSTAEYLWRVENVVPFLKIDKGLQESAHGAQMMKPIPQLDELLDRAHAHGIFGTKMRSLISLADPAGIDDVLQQQFNFAERVLDRALVPIIEPEIDIHSPEKSEAEQLLKFGLDTYLGALQPDEQVVLKLTLPTVDNLYEEFTHHPNVLRVAALSGGYSREDACTLLSRNHRVIASFSRALTEGLNAQQTEQEFDASLAQSISRIYEASVT